MRKTGEERKDSLLQHSPALPTHPVPDVCPSHRPTRFYSFSFVSPVSLRLPTKCRYARKGCIPSSLPPSFFVHLSVHGTLLWGCMFMCVYACVCSCTVLFFFHLFCFLLFCFIDVPPVSLLAFFFFVLPHRVYYISFFFSFYRWFLVGCTTCRDGFAGTGEAGKKKFPKENTPACSRADTDTRVHSCSDKGDT